MAPADDSRDDVNFGQAVRHLAVVPGGKDGLVLSCARRTAVHHGWMKQKAVPKAARAKTAAASSAGESSR